MAAQAYDVPDPIASNLLNRYNVQNQNLGQPQGQQNNQYLTPTAGPWDSQSQSNVDNAQAAGQQPANVPVAQQTPAVNGSTTFPGVQGGFVPTLGNAPPGYDQSKWADPNKQDPKYIAGRIIASGGNPQQVAQALGATYLGSDRIKMPDGTVVDTVIDYGPGGKNAPQWAIIDFDANGKEIAPNFGGGGAAGSGSAGAGGAGGAGGAMGGIQSQQGTDLYNLLMKRAQQGLDVNPNDPIIKAQTDAYRAETTNAAKNLEAQQAERGGPNANPEAVQRSMAEKGGQATGAFEAGLMQQELASRRQEIEQALQMGTSFLTAEQQLQLQQELAQIANAQQAYQFDVTNQRVTQLGY